ncbi:Aste57867_23802 [Aphanomyces stellatus]|uniref:Aste57867_23802 protein n=1 Tax=Aphanomyces stellatus TaxID=120398 RepID=A0A485LNT4_9STRA|nr:hypothetical protein As57867_023729 [Aphanomyces stellatus]VFU00447.1 Aste57867_23802 [Aphanomyces stellatus]
MRIEVSGKENLMETTDSLSWMTPVPLEDGWLDKMDSSLTSVDEGFFPDLSWSDSSESFFHASTEALPYVEETPPAKKYTHQPHAKPKRVKGDALRLFEPLKKPKQLEPLIKLDADHNRAQVVHAATFLDQSSVAPPTATASVYSPNIISFGDALTSSKRSWGGWSWDDQVIFFQAMKSKWTSATLLPKRWDQLTRKLPHKSVVSVQQFYTAMVAHIHDLLSLVHVHFNQDSPDEIRMALSCWYRVCASELDISNPLHKKRLAGRLKHTLIKSRKNSETAILAKQTKRGQSIVHTPVVRKKRPLQSPDMPSSTRSPMAVGASADDDDTKRFKPSPIDLKKKPIKVRFVPIDKATQTLVAQIGARPKVELKMNGSKRISDVCAHMMTKWAAVQDLVGPDACFRVVPLGDRLHPGWGADDISVTCLDIFHQCLRQPMDDDTVTLEYRWTDAATSSRFSTPTRPSPPAPQEQQQPTPAHEITYVNLDFLPPPIDDHTEAVSPWEEVKLPPETTTALTSTAPPTSTDFNGFLDEGPSACTAWMESFLPPLDDHSTPQPMVPPPPMVPLSTDGKKPKKRITPTLIPK